MPTNLILLFCVLAFLVNGAVTLEVPVKCGETIFKVKVRDNGSLKDLVNNIPYSILLANQLNPVLEYLSFETQPQANINALFGRLTPLRLFGQCNLPADQQRDVDALFKDLTADYIFGHLYFQGHLLNGDNLSKMQLAELGVTPRHTALGISTFVLAPPYITVFLHRLLEPVSEIKKFRIKFHLEMTVHDIICKINELAHKNGVPLDLKPESRKVLRKNNTRENILRMDILSQHGIKYGDVVYFCAASSKPLDFQRYSADPYTFSEP